MPICVPSDTDWTCAYSDEEIAALDPAVKHRAEALAWSTLASLTAYQIGVCPVTVRPCLAGCEAPGTWMASTVRGSGWASLPHVGIGSFVPHIDLNGAWVNSCGCASAGDCSCTTLSEAILPGPVGSIESVVVDGVVLPPSAYRVDNGNRLVRTDGESWPVCQDFGIDAVTESYQPFSGTFGTTGSYEFTREGNIVTVTVTPDVTTGVPGTALPDRFIPQEFQVIGQNPTVRLTLQHLANAGTFLITRLVGPPAMLVTQYLAVDAVPDVAGTPGTFTVTYYQGSQPDELTRYAAGVLATEFYKACSNGKCRLPSGVTSVTRQGVSYQIVAGSFPGGFTGIHEVDAVIRLYNPHGLTMPPRVVSPDQRRPRQTTWVSR